MKKSKLIELLNNIKGNPDIIFYNGFVEDWQDLSSQLVESRLVKRSLSNWIYYIELEEQVRRKDFNHKLSEERVKELTSLYKEVEWEENHRISDEAVKRGDYKSKRVYYLQSKIRGVSTFDRMGNINY